jgi:hypothetical protein
MLTDLFNVLLFLPTFDFCLDNQPKERLDAVLLGMFFHVGLNVGAILRDRFDLFLQISL